MSTKIATLLFLSVAFGTILAAPQLRQIDESPKPYDFNYQVDNPPTNTYFGQNEAGDAAGRVNGQYYVYLADGRLMTVDYTIVGESGFVPRISFSNQGIPRQG